MEKVWIVGIAILIFLIFLFLYWKLTNGFVKKVQGEKMWNQWGTRLYYWQGAIYTSAAYTILILYLLKWAHVLTF